MFCLLFSEDSGPLFHRTANDAAPVRAWRAGWVLAHLTGLGWSGGKMGQGQSKPPELCSDGLPSQDNLESGQPGSLVILSSEPNTRCPADKQAP